ncbi:hypothetical protein ACN3E9_06015 [Vibrio pectenicida]|uniref:hypothetical protein n=1 Tax=Vibrio pectenicida TaxID=62763 RepID=UPI003B98FEBC
MKLASFFLSTLLLISSSAYANTNTTTYVYCGLPDASDWEWLLDTDDNYIIISGRWGRVTEASGHYFRVFRVSEEVWEQQVFNCPAGYISQPADSGTSRWEIFEVIRANGSSYFIDAYKTYYLQGNIDANFQLRV